MTGWSDEVDDMVEVLMGRQPPPMQNGVLTLMEVADAYKARALEMTGTIQQLEADGVIGRGHPLYRFRTGKLRTFIELAKGASELGSRRVTVEKMEYDQTTHTLS